jgi:CBS domain-containing protein
MYVRTILKSKGSDVALAHPDESLVDACRRMAERRIGALIVSADGKNPAGILSERDVAHAVAEYGDRIAALTVSDLMTVDLITCTPEDSIDSLMETMTEQRVRHLPVMRDGALAGVVSIGDVVKFRLDEMAHESEALREYIVGA